MFCFDIAYILVYSKLLCGKRLCVVSAFRVKKTNPKTKHKSSNAVVTTDKDSVVCILQALHNTTVLVRQTEMW